MPKDAEFGGSADSASGASGCGTNIDWIRSELAVKRRGSVRGE